MSHILVIADDVALVRDICARLRRRGHEVTVAFDGSEGYLSAIGERPDAVVLDLHLPGFSGQQVLALLAQSRDTARIPVLALAPGQDPQLSIARVRATGAADVLSRPLRGRDVARRVEALLERLAAPAA